MFVQTKPRNLMTSERLYVRIKTPCRATRTKRHGLQLSLSVRCSILKSLSVLFGRCFNVTTTSKHSTSSSSSTTEKRTIYLATLTLPLLFFVCIDHPPTKQTVDIQHHLEGPSSFIDHLGQTNPRLLRPQRPTNHPLHAT